MVPPPVGRFDPSSSTTTPRSPESGSVNCPVHFGYRFALPLALFPAQGNPVYGPPTAHEPPLYEIEHDVRLLVEPDARGRRHRRRRAERGLGTRAVTGGQENALAPGLVGGREQRSAAALLDRHIVRVVEDDEADPGMLVAVGLAELDRSWPSQCRRRHPLQPLPGRSRISARSRNSASWVSLLQSARAWDALSGLLRRPSKRPSRMALSPVRGEWFGRPISASDRLARQLIDRHALVGLRHPAVVERLVAAPPPRRRPRARPRAASGRTRPPS